MSFSARCASASGHWGMRRIADRRGLDSENFIVPHSPPRRLLRLKKRHANPLVGGLVLVGRFCAANHPLHFFRRMCRLIPFSLTMAFLGLFALTLPALQAGEASRHGYDI